MTTLTNALNLHETPRLLRAASAAQAGALVRADDDNYLLLGGDDLNWQACRVSADIWMASPDEVILATADTPQHAWSWLVLPNLSLTIPRVEAARDGLMKPWAVIPHDLALTIRRWVTAIKRDSRASRPPSLISGPPLVPEDQPTHAEWRNEQAAVHEAWVQRLCARAAARTFEEMQVRAEARRDLFSELRKLLQTGVQGLRGVVEQAQLRTLALTGWTGLASHAAGPARLRGVRFDEAGLTIEQHGDAWVLVLANSDSIEVMAEAIFLASADE